MFSSDVTGTGITETATNSTKLYQCLPIFTMLLALGNPRYEYSTVGQLQVWYSTV